MTDIKHIQDLKSRKRWSEIITLLKPVVSSQGCSIWQLTELGFAYSQLNRLNEARYCYKLWLEKEVNSPRPYYCLGYLCYLEEQWNQALEWFDQALEIFPEYLVCLYRSGVALYNMLKYRKAKERFIKSITIYQESTDTEYKKRNAKTYYKSIFRLGKCYFELEQYNNALACFTKLDKEDVRNYVNPLFKRYNLAKGLFGAKRLPEALEILKNLKRKEYVLDLMARIHADNEDADQALYCFEKALNIRPVHYIFIHRAEFYVKKGEVEKAKSDYHQALKRDRMGKHKTLLALGNIAFDQNRMEEAKSFYIRAIEFKKKIYDADYADAHLALAEYYRLTDQTEEAQKEYAVASELMKEWTA